MHAGHCLDTSCAPQPVDHVLHSSTDAARTRNQYNQGVALASLDSHHRSFLHSVGTKYLL
ncbi:hypothetical protein PLICRDRAFT_41591 [Plicaturopsis crispa FD-325 SS-3]|nr:hypothetical protein PLICRDRAFT_41591 [Plicaturopsis crispa FD-325 SS-3]